MRRLKKYKETKKNTHLKQTLLNKNKQKNRERYNYILFIIKLKSKRSPNPIEKMINDIVLIGKGE